MPRQLSEVTTIIRDNPDLEPKALLERLKSAGIDYTHDKITKARRRLAEAAERESNPVKKARKKRKTHAYAAASGRPRPGSASDFIVSLPSTLSNAEALDKAIAAGFDISAGVVSYARRVYAHMLRTTGRGAERIKPTADAKAEAAPKKVARATANGSVKRQQVAMAMMAAGLDTAREVLTELEEIHARFGA